MLARRCARFLSQVAGAAAGDAQTLAPPPSAVVKHPFFVPRNSNGNLPVYSDIRNGGTRLLVTIRNVDGNASVCIVPPLWSLARPDTYPCQALAKDLKESLFEAGSEAARRMKVRTNHQHVVVQGGRWSQEVQEWLKAKGF
jgi:large subunit ribosomal protein L49